MTRRLDYATSAPDAIRAILNLERTVRESGLEPSLLHLIKLRASQLNGCAYCVDMHSKDARAAGEQEQRLYALPVWKESPFYSDRERAALDWTEALTLLGENDISDELYRAAREHFSETELVNLTMAIVAINGWNRIAVAFRPPVGEYRPAASAA